MGYRALSNWFVGLAVFAFAAITGMQTLLGKEQMRLVPASSRVAQVPSVELLERPYFSELADWSADNFWTRGPLTALSAGAQYFGFNSTSDERVLPGKDGWLFFGDATHLNLLTGQVDLKEYTSYLETLLAERRDWLAERGASYIYLVGPSAHSIYVDQLTWRSPNIPVPTPVEVMAQTINSREPGLIVAPFEALREARKNGVLTYHKNDSHWTRAGAAVALNETLEVLGYDPIEWAFSRYPSTPGAFGRMIGVPIMEEGASAALPDGSRPESLDASEYCEPLGRDAVRRCVLFQMDGKEGRALILGDSFGNYLQEPVIRAFGETLVLNMWEADAIPEKRFPVTTIEAFKPDVVIELTAEYRAQPCSQTQMGGCRGYLGTPNPFGSDFEVRDRPQFSGSFSGTYELADFASERSDFTSGAIRLTGLDVSRDERVFAEVSVPEGFSGRILGGVPNKVPNWVDTSKIIVRSTDAGFSGQFVIEISPEPEGRDRFIRFATDGPSTGQIEVRVAPENSLK